MPIPTIDATSLATVTGGRTTSTNDLLVQQLSSLNSSIQQALNPQQSQVQNMMMAMMAVQMMRGQG